MYLHLYIVLRDGTVRAKLFCQLLICGNYSGKVMLKYNITAKWMTFSDKSLNAHYLDKTETACNSTLVKCDTHPLKLSAQQYSWH